MKYETRKEASAKIAENIDAIYALIAEAEEIAEQNDVGFNLAVTYGMGGSYIPNGSYNDNWHPEREDKTRGGWYPSSQSC